MPNINVVLPDGSTKQVEENATVKDVATAIGTRLADAALVGKIGGKLVDLNTVVHDGDVVEIVTSRSPEALEILRHSTAHIMAAAIREIWPEACFGVGPSIEDGFYYDVKLDHAITTEDLVLIEDHMAGLVKRATPFVRDEISRDEALDTFAGDPLKEELIYSIPDDEIISTYTSGDFIDFCRGPHVPDASKIGAFKLTKLAGAYWRGDSDREMLQRIYGTAWFTKKDLDAYLTRIEEAEKRDHRKLGKELGIYTMDDLAGVGLPLYLPAGARIIRLLQEWLRRELYRRGYEEVITPHIYKADVWKVSGHYDFYHDNMYFFEINEGTEEEPRLSEYAVKPMNCPGHVMLYRNSIHSYKELPIRYFEFGTVYRHEMSGVVHGLLRARGFTQDDAHIFCMENQVVDEVLAILDLADNIMKEFGFEYSAEISTRPDHYIGTLDMWNHAESFLREAIEQRGIPYEINEGDGAFYGPKIDIKIKDAIGRWWQCSTVQVDFNMPERFDITYRTADNTEARPWMLHRALFGSIERFLGILIEQYAGALPLWLAPVQATIIPIADRHLDAAKVVKAQLEAVGGRVTISSENEPMRVKIAKAQQQKIPYMLVMGDKEIEAGEVSVRERHEGDIGKMKVDEFARIIADAQVK